MTHVHEEEEHLAPKILHYCEAQGDIKR